MANSHDTILWKHWNYVYEVLLWEKKSYIIMKCGETKMQISICCVILVK